MKNNLLIAMVFLGVCASSMSAEAWGGLRSERAEQGHVKKLLTGGQYIGETAKAEQILTEISQRNFVKNQPPIILEWSLERDNLNKRTKLWNDPNKQSWIYLFNRDNIVGFFAIKGKVSSVNSQITNTNYEFANSTIESPSMDGSYGTNGDAVFFFTVDGAYMEWNGTYLLVDKPIRLNAEPMLSNEN